MRARHNIAGAPLRPDEMFITKPIDQNRRRPSEPTTDEDNADIKQAPRTP